MARKVERRRKKTAARTHKHQTRADILVALAGDSKRARPMSEVGAFRAVPTDLTSLNRAATVGGVPISCTWLIHGPSGGGKTALLIAMMKAFVKAGGLAAFIDAEMSADTRRWIRQLGLDTQSVLYVGRTGEEDTEPLTYEVVVDEVDGIMGRYKLGKREGWIAPGTPLIVGVDSISRMVPAGLMKRMAKDGAKALRSGYGREQANMNKVWLAELGTKVGDDDILFAVIAHELEKESKNAWSADYKVRGGAALIYDAMMQVRVEFAGQVRDLAKEKDGPSTPAVGKRHSALLLKNKHGPAFSRATFYTSNGQGLAPVGFDRVREVLHEAIQRGIVEGPEPKEMTAGSRFKWKGRTMTLKQFYKKPELAEVIDLIARELDADLIEELNGKSGDSP